MSAALVAWADGVRLRVRLTPAGGADRLEGLARDSAGLEHLKARVRAVPENGEANAALEALVAKAFGAPRRDVRVVSGATARVKTLALHGIDLERAIAALAKVCAAGKANP